jgi:two-component system sensor kinase FixL
MADWDRDHHHGYVQSFLDTRKAKIIGIGREVEARYRDGRIFPAHLAVGEVVWGGEFRFVGMMRDLTDTKQAEERRLRQHLEMIKASRLTTMGEMAAAMAHELNQPLAAIANYASGVIRMLDSGSVSGEETKTALESINSQAHRAGEIIRRLRGFVRPDNLALEVVDVAELIDEIRPLAELDARANNISLTIDVPKGLPQIMADELQIQQVVLNLLRNGVDAMKNAEPDDRQLKLQVEICDADQIRINIIDRGPGVPDEVKNHLFDAFYSTKADGMGMGLAICLTITKAHGGELSFLNNPAIGATFSITIPTKVI